MTDTFTIVTAEAAAPDPAKHVNYVQGMVLGVDDFTQEFAYLSGRDQWLAREALGYGVLRGLRVRVEPGGADGPRVYVSAGVALTARGELVCVPDDQCAYLNPWLSANQARVPASTPATLYVRLCYSSCATDSQPIPGEPCRDDDDLMAPSRIKDWYRLELTTDPPAQVEEDGLRAFVAWLRAVRKSIGLSPVEALSLEDFVAAVRAAWLPAGEGEGSPPLAPPYRLAEELLIPGYDADSYLRAALRVWTNEVRPALSAQGQACARPPADGCILLAALDLELTNDRRQVLEVLEVREAEAPFLLHLRMLQEWLLSGENEALPAESVRAEQAYGLAADVGLAHEYARADHTHGTPPLPTLDGDVQSGAVGSPPDATTDPATITTTVTAIQGTPVDPVAPEEGQALVFTEGAWRPGVVSVDLQPAASVRAERAYGLPSGVGVAVEYARADHTHGTPPAPSLAGEVTATVALQNDTVYRLNTRVARIMDRAVADPAAIPPFEGAVLKLRRNERGELFWAPASDETGGGAPRSFVVAAGAFRPDGAPLLTSFGNLVARPLSASPLVYLLIFDHFDGKPYVVTGAPIASASAPDPHVFEYLGTTTEAAERLSRDDQSVLAEEIRALRNERAVLVRVQRIAFPLATADKIELLPTTVGFTVEISRYP